MENKNESIINKNNEKEEEIKKEEINHDIEPKKEINTENLLFEAKILNVPENYEPKNVITFKIIIIGNSGVGKTSITNNAVKNVFFENYRSTIGMEIFSLFLKIDHKLIKLQIWDTCGQEIYRSLITNFYRNSSLAIIVYSIEKKESFKDIDMWIKELKVNSSPDIKIILIGNKSDLADKREVSYEEGAKYLDEPEIINFYETSAKTGDNVRKIFEEVGVTLYKDYIKYKDQGSLKSSSTFRTNKSNKKVKKKTCC